MTNTTFKPLPIIFDRLAHALDAHGIKVKRSQLLEISAAAFGHRNSNALTAAAKAGDINPYPAQVIGRVELPDGQSVIIVNDQLANSPYAIDEAFLEQVAAEERREEIGITPYGHLAALYDVLDATDIPAIAGGPVTSEVHVGRISHKHGNNIYVAADDDGLTMQIAEYARENWDDEVGEYADEGENPATMTDEEVVSAYFELCENHEVEEYLETSVEEIAARILPVTQETPVTPRRYALQTEMDNEPIFIVDRHVKGKDGEYVTVAQMPRTDDPRADIALAQKIINGLNGDTVPAVAPGNILVSELVSLAEDLESGPQEDVWYDAHEYMDEDNPEDSDTIKWKRICEIQLAMSRASEILNSLASEKPAVRQVSIHTAPALGITTKAMLPQCERCGSILNDEGLCKDKTCPFSDCTQDDLNGWEGHPDRDMILLKKEFASRGAIVHSTPTDLGYTSVKDDILKRQETEPVWITDDEGADTFQVTAATMKALGLEFHKDGEDTLPLTEDEYEVLLGGQTLNNETSHIVECGFSVLYKGKKWLAPEIGFDFDPDDEAARIKALESATAWVKEKREEIEHIGGEIILSADATDSEHELTVLLPMSLALDAESVDDWREALSWLMRLESERSGPRVTCDFLPQTWIRDNAYTVDPNGDTAWNATFDALRWGNDAARRMLDTDMDYFATEGATTHEWIRQWTMSNPFEVLVVGLEELFDISE